MKMKAAESREGKRSLSMCNDEESGAKRNKKQIPKITGNKDVYCWTCHKPGNVATCSECPRAYHLKCGHLDRIPKPSEKWVCPECDTVQRADKQASTTPAHVASFSKLLEFVLERVKRVDGVDNFSTPVDTNKWHDYLDYVVQPMDLPKLKSNIETGKYRSVESFLSDFRWLVHASYVYNSVHSVYTKIAKSMLNVAKQECEEVKNCSECYMHACTLGDTWFIEPCTTPHVLVWAQLSGFPYWPAKVMRQLSGDVVDVRFFGDHTRANVPAAACFLYSRVMPCSVKSKKHSSKITNGIEEAETYVKNLKSTYNTFCYAQYRVNYVPKEDECMRKLQLPEFPTANDTPEFLAKVESLRKEKMLEDKKFHSEMKQVISEQEKSKQHSLPQKRKSLDSGPKFIEMKRKLVKIDTPKGQKFAIMNMSGSESDSSPKRPAHQKASANLLTPDAKTSVPGGNIQLEMNGGHNCHKTSPRVDDETIKQVLARSPKELTASGEKISPKSLTPPKDSGIIESLSRKLFTTPKKIANGAEERVQVTRSLSQRLNTSKREAPVESDSDSDALVIAEESSTFESPLKKKTSDENSPKSKINTPAEHLDLCIKRQPSEMKKKHILIRKSYISSEKMSPTTRALAALPVTAGRTVAIPGRSSMIVHRALPPAVPEIMENRTSPLVSRRTRRSMNINTTYSVAENPIDSSIKQPSGDISTEIVSTDDNPGEHSVCVPQTEGSPEVDRPPKPTVSSDSADDISLPTDEGKSDIPPAGKNSNWPSKGAFEPQPDNPTESVIGADRFAINSQSADDVSCPVGEMESEEMSLNNMPTTPSGIVCELKSSEAPISQVTQPATDSSSTGVLSLPQSRNVLFAPSESGRESSRAATDASSTDVLTLPRLDLGSISLFSLANEVPRRPSKESSELEIDPPAITPTEPAQAMADSPSSGDVSSFSVGKELSEFMDSGPLVKDRGPGLDDPSKCDEQHIISGKVSDKESNLSGSKGVETVSVESSVTIVPSERTMEPAEMLSEGCNIPSVESNERLDFLDLQDGGEDLDKDSSVTQLSYPRITNSPEDLVQKPDTTQEQQMTPVKSFICYSTSSSPESPSVTSSPENSVLAINAVRKMPASMEVPVIKVVRTQHVTPIQDIKESSYNSSELEVARSNVGTESSADATPVEAELSTSNCKVSEGDVVLLTAGAKIHSTNPALVDEDDTVLSTEKQKSGIGPKLTYSGDSVSERDVKDSQEKPKPISSLDMLNGDLSHLYEDLDPTEEDDESDEPMSSLITPGDKATSSNAMCTPVSISGTDESQKEAHPVLDELHGSQLCQQSEDVALLSMDCNDPCTVDTTEKTEGVQSNAPGTIGSLQVAPSPLKDFTDENTSNALPFAESVETDTSEDLDPVPVSSPGEKERLRRDKEEERKRENVSTGRPASEYPDKATVISEPATVSLSEAKVSSASENGADLSPASELQPPKANLSSIDIPDTLVETNHPDTQHTPKQTELATPHTPEKIDGKCTCIMCHVAHPGASFDKTVADYQLLKSIELDEPKRGLPKETEEFFRRLRESDILDLQEEANRHELDSSRDRRRKSINSLEQKPILVSSLVPRRSTESLEIGPSTSSGKTSRPLPGLVTLTSQRRSSCEQKNGHLEKNFLGGLQISSSMSLNPSALQDLSGSSKSPTNQCNADARKTPVANAASSSESQSGSEPKKATQNPTTMPLPIVIKPDPDAEEAPGVPNAQVPPAPSKPTIKLKQMSTLLERPPPPPSPKKPDVSRKECSTPKFNMVPPFEPKKTLEDVRKLIESKSQFISAKLKKDIYTLFDQIQHEYDSHMELLEHIADASLNTVESTLETNKNLVFEEMKIRLRNQVDAHVADVKKKQWCILCGNEAAFHCCWGYNYCCEDCQKSDWAEHTKVCTQYSMSATDPYIRASPRFQALLEKQMLVGGNKKIMVQDLIDSPVAVSVQSNSPGKAKPTPQKGRKILAGPRTSFLESELSASLDSPISSVAKTSAMSTSAIQRITDQVTSYKIVQPARAVRILNPGKPRLPQVLPKPQTAPRAAPRPVVSPPSSDMSQSGKIATRLTTLGKWGSVKLPPSIEVSRAPATPRSTVQRKQVMTTGRIIPGQQNTNRTSFLRVMDDKEIASILRRNHLNEY